MTGHEQELAGPDLARGVEVSTVRPGQLVAGHAFGEAVLLARVDPNWFAIGATCTHYGAPLADGLLVGETIRCPWHHACFELRNGAASAAPALTDLSSYDVVVENTIVRVARKREGGMLSGEAHRPRRSRAPEVVRFEEIPADGPRSIVIIGAGAAGVACAEMLRRERYRGPITLVDADRDSPYDRPNLSKDFLAGTASEEWLPLHPNGFYESQQIEILPGVEARSVDVNTKTVALSDGRTLPFGGLLIATGATPIGLPIPGGERIDYLRSLADSRAIIDKASNARSALVIGAGFIGLEVAASLVKRGLPVHVVARETLPLERVLGREIGSLVKSVHEKQGVIFHLGRTVRTIEADGAILDDGTRLDADLIVGGIGVRPNVGIADRAGLLVDDGISVNEFLETSSKGIFAAGDVARWPDAYSDSRLRVEHWVVAQRQGQTVARNMMGNHDRFDDIPFFWSNHYDKLHIRYTGHVDRWDEKRIDGNVMGMDCAVSFLVGGKRRAIATINRDRQNLEAEAAMEKEVMVKPSSPLTPQTAGLAT
jgi:NADPH-dependent 2,4-dienoyl-CoA reductase/sulfur reductase-like enzyme/nitrite reductase/ring-hydroxylating ferredoxin subunit